MRLENLINQKFGRLTVIELAPKKVLPCGNSVTMWLCKCECGNTKVVPANNLKIGKTKSCGCLNAELSSKRRKKHGGIVGNKRERLYDIWRAMKERCYNEKGVNYPNYGGRGIFVCDEWLFDYTAFKEWALSNGYQENLTIDRIDFNKGYCPQNCRWATKKEQNNNTRHNTMITAFGETNTLSQWSEKTGISTDVISARIKKLHWNAEKALSTPVRKITR